MNLLTGKAKTDFLLWIQSKGIKWNPTDFSLDLAEAMHCAIIIEWLDTVKILLKILPTLTGKFHYDIDNTFGYNGNAKTRAEAIKSAIEKANQIYNETHA